MTVYLGASEYGCASIIFKDVLQVTQCVMVVTLQHTDRALSAGRSASKSSNLVWNKPLCSYGPLSRDGEWSALTTLAPTTHSTTPPGIAESQLVAAVDYVLGFLSSMRGKMPRDDPTKLYARTTVKSCKTLGIGGNTPVMTDNVSTVLCRRQQLMYTCP